MVPSHVWSYRINSKSIQVWNCAGTVEVLGHGVLDNYGCRLLTSRGAWLHLCQTCGMVRQPLPLHKARNRLFAMWRMRRRVVVTLDRPKSSHNLKRKDKCRFYITLKSSLDSQRDLGPFCPSISLKSGSNLPGNKTERLSGGPVRSFVVVHSLLV